MYKRIIFPALCLLLACNARNQVTQPRTAGDKAVGGGCEGCQAVYESPVAFDQLSWTDTLPGFATAEKKLLVYGTVYKPDGVTPAPGIVLYIYHTNEKGLYAPGPNATGWEKRHGALRGWVKTNAAGQYRFYTQVPASYPNSQNPQHIHPTIKEPGFKEYYIDEFLFDDDPLLTTAERRRQENRGGYGVLTTAPQNGLLAAQRNIYLGRNIPGYPQPARTGLQSGLNIGDNCPAFEPLHLAGPDRGTHACPMCKYGYGRGLMVWFTHSNVDTLRLLAHQFEIQSKGKEPRPRLFLIYLPGEVAAQKAAATQASLLKWYTDNGFTDVALLWLDGAAATEARQLYRIHPQAMNTVLLYDKRKVVRTEVDMPYSTTNFYSLYNQLTALPL